MVLTMRTFGDTEFHGMYVSNLRSSLHWSTCLNISTTERIFGTPCATETWMDNSAEPPELAVLISMLVAAVHPTLRQGSLMLVTAGAFGIHTEHLHHSHLQHHVLHRHPEPIPLLCLDHEEHLVCFSGKPDFLFFFRGFLLPSLACVVECGGYATYPSESVPVKHVNLVHPDGIQSFNDIITVVSARLVPVNESILVGPGLIRVPLDIQDQQRTIVAQELNQAVDALAELVVAVLSRQSQPLETVHAKRDKDHVECAEVITHWSIRNKAWRHPRVLLRHQVAHGGFHRTCRVLLALDDLIVHVDHILGSVDAKDISNVRSQGLIRGC